MCLDLSGSCVKDEHHALSGADAGRVLGYERNRPAVGLRAGVVRRFVYHGERCALLSFSAGDDEAAGGREGRFV